MVLIWRLSNSVVISFVGFVLLLFAISYYGYRSSITFSCFIILVRREGATDIELGERIIMAMEVMQKSTRIEKVLLCQIDGQ
jgi:hypothetical protein